MTAFVKLLQMGNVNFSFKVFDKVKTCIVTGNTRQQRCVDDNLHSFYCHTRSMTIVDERSVGVEQTDTVSEKYDVSLQQRLLCSAVLTVRPISKPTSKRVVDGGTSTNFGINRTKKYENLSTCSGRWSGAPLWPLKASIMCIRSTNCRRRCW